VGRVASQYDKVVPKPQYIIAIGPESSGKSTLVNLLAMRLGYPVRKEYAREYLANLDRPYSHADLRVIGEYQQDQAAQMEPSPILCDTDAVTLKVWQDLRYPQGEDVITPIIESYEMTKRLYLLLEPDLPWKADPLREHPDLSDRQVIYDANLKVLQKYACNYVSISGQGNARLEMAMECL